ncbi:hypothetical protein O181_020988 [Austropuccinia psidii MF-1]|uniref:Reverse transcriptase domain-containing protein n=1 Tax=Austropuccinia psidii MF-1 TaxID=1389203 RepID=A0A9Q3CE06_9BASI|nr:hypothetical protein [Austropuccinia psidii MF-1]
MSELPENIPLVVLASSESPSLFVTHHTKYMVELSSFPSFEWDFLVIDTPKGEDLILGFDLLNCFNPSIDWRKGLITFNFDHKNYDYPSISFRNEFPFSNTCTALVGCSRTSSFPNYVHIPSPNSPWLLLLSRDAVFNEIKYVGEYNSISSLYLLHGNVDLPPSSYHYSLEGSWDEEEEPEEIKAVMQVVPSASHQYLNAFSKLKEEKLPPHHACDHHIELAVILLPVGVISSCANKESETLNSYISKNLNKGFILPRSSPTGANVLFFKNKDGGLCLFIEYHKLNAVTRKNKYLFPPVTQLLTVFSGSFIFSNICLSGLYKLLRIKVVDEHLTAFRTKYGIYEYLVMPFGLTNAPTSFQNLVNDILSYIIYCHFVVYLD